MRPPARQFPVDVVDAGSLRTARSRHDMVRGARDPAPAAAQPVGNGARAVKEFAFRGLWQSPASGMPLA
jgi:hypothetical protein